MFARHFYLRRPPRIRVSRRLLRPRLQHDQHGPHKEYFQHPSQYPTDLTTGQSSASNASTRLSQPATIIPETHTTAPTSQGPSLIRRVIRNVFIINLFLFMGAAVGSAIVTWDYLQPPFEPDSEDYQELKEEIDEILETCPMTENLRNNGWFEEPIIQKRSPVEGAAGRHFVEDTLSGVQGVTMKVFRHPTIHSTALVFFAGFGVEGWPDVVHGGAIMSMFSEAYSRHMAPVMKEEGLHDELEQAAVNLRIHSFQKPLRPGEVYTILSVTKGWGHSQNKETGNCYVANTTQSFLVSADTLPTIQTDGNAFPIETPAMIGLESSSDSLHAASTIHSQMKTDKVTREEGETDDQYRARVSASVDEFLKRRFKLNDAQRANRDSEGITRD